MSLVSPVKHPDKLFIGGAWGNQTKQCRARDAEFLTRRFDDLTRELPS